MELVENAIGWWREAGRGGGSRKESAQLGMARANGRDNAPASIPRSLQQISTDKFPPCLEPSVSSSRSSARLKFPPSSSRPRQHPIFLSRDFPRFSSHFRAKRRASRVRHASRSIFRIEGYKGESRSNVDTFRWKTTQRSRAN